MADPGSSPHTRGLHYRAFPMLSVLRIIPAHAGFTRPRWGSTSTPADHPRTRGVYRRWYAALVRRRGSSPHTRGLRGRVHAGAAEGGIIPAHAGFTPGPSSPRASSWDHPRTRGVYPMVASRRPSVVGSSPHTRGLRDRVTGVTWPLRIIPAHAGFTRARTQPACAAWDHPRTRGVYG